MRHKQVFLIKLSGICRILIMKVICFTIFVGGKFVTVALDQSGNTS